LIVGGALAGAAGGMTERLIAGKGNSVKAVASDMAGGAAGVMGGAVGGEVLGSVTNKAPAYSPGLYWGGNATRNPVDDEIRKNAAGKPCPNCGRTMIPGTKTAPTAQHKPPLADFHKMQGKNMTPAQRVQYAQSPKAFDGAVCKSCNGQEGYRL